MGRGRHGDDGDIARTHAVAESNAGGAFVPVLLLPTKERTALVPRKKLVTARLDPVQVIYQQ